MITSRAQIEAARERAYRAQGWTDDDSRASRRSLTEAQRQARDFAEGVEAALLWILGSAGEPLPEKSVAVAG